MIRALTAAIIVCISGCATYAPAPLPTTTAVLAEPVARVLETRANAIDRPWLAKVNVNLSAPLQPAAIAALAAVNNPDLLALRARSGVVDAQAFAAGLLPDPSFSIGVDKVLSGPDILLNITAALGLDLDALRKRSVTREQAAAQARQVRLDLAWAEWQAAGQARIQAVRVMGLSRLVSIARESQTSAQLQLERSGQAAARGDLATSDAETARIAEFDAAERLRVAEHDLQTARLQLTQLLGLPAQARPLLAEVPLPDIPSSPERLMSEALRNRSDLAALRAGYAAQEASVHLAVLQQFPSLHLTINSNRDSAGNLLLGPAIDFTLPVWNRNRGGIAVERATREALKAEYAARVFRTRADIVAAADSIALNRRQLEQAQRSLTTLEQQASASESAARRGDTTLASAASARQRMRDRQSTIAQLELAIREQTIALELLCGTPIEGWK